MRPLRVYLDTSVLGGCFDEGFSEDSMRVVELARGGRLILLLSDVVVAELGAAPPRFKRFLDHYPPPAWRLSLLLMRLVDFETPASTRESLAGAGLKMRHTSLRRPWPRADAIVSWNFRHIVRLDKIKAYNHVNLACGYGVLTIVTPKELMFYERDEDKAGI